MNAPESDRIVAFETPVAAARNAVTTGETRPARRDKKEKARPTADWVAKCTLGDDEWPISNVANAIIILENATECKNLLAFDDMLQSVILTSPVPRHNEPVSWAGFEPGPICDEDVTAIQAWLQRAGLTTIGVGSVHQAVRAHAKSHRFHPVRDYLNALVWDGEERAEQWLSTYLGAPGGDYSKQIGTMFLISMVARIFRPGCQCDYMLVFESEQGDRKSSACRVLGGEWFSENMPDNVSTKDASQHLRGKWLVELGELSVLGKSQIEALKKFLTNLVERYRPSYGREEVHEPRTCVFIATTNRRTYLSDPTGNRRFWPVKTGKFDLDALRRDRDQLFAEAVSLYQAGREWWPDEGLAQLIKDEQEARYEGDAWEDSIAAWITDLNPVKGADGVYRKRPITIGEIAKDALSFDKSRIGTADQRRIMAILERLKWAHGARGLKGERFWYPPDDPIKNAHQTAAPDAPKSASVSASVRKMLDFNDL